MLVKFVIEPTAIDDSTTRAHIRRLLEKWERFGVLVYPARDDVAIWGAALARLNPAVRKAWVVALGMVGKNHRICYRWHVSDGETGTWRGLRTPADVAGGDGKFDVALLDRRGAATLEIPDGESKFFDKVEGLRLWDVDASERFADSERLGTEPIRVGEQVEDIWEARFRVLAEYSRDVVVVDQYAVGPGQIQGVLRLLRLLDRDATRCNVTIYSTVGAGAGEEPGDVEAKVRRQAAGLKGGGIRRVRVKLFEKEGFRKYAHDRHVRFDRNILRIGRGVRVFVHGRVAETTDVGLATLGPDGFEQKERDLDRLVAQTHEFSVGPDGME